MPRFLEPMPKAVFLTLSEEDKKLRKAQELAAQHIMMQLCGCHTEAHVPVMIDSFNVSEKQNGYFVNINTDFHAPRLDTKMAEFLSYVADIYGLENAKVTLAKNGKSVTLTTKSKCILFESHPNNLKMR